MKNQNNLAIIENQKRFGIVGGLGTETSCKFCINVDNKIKRISGKQPDISMEIVPVTLEMEENIINGKPSTEFLDLISKAIIRLTKVNVDFIVIPCNSVHIFLDKFRKISNKPIISIIEETAKKCKSLEMKRVGILASSTTIKEKLHDRELKKVGITLIIPDKDDQLKINECIKKKLLNQADHKNLKDVIPIISKLKNKGAEAVILGCTELGHTISQKVSVLPIINTLHILEDSTIEKLGVSS